MNSIPPWAKKTGIVGLVLICLWVFLEKTLGAIYESETQSFWQGTAKPFLVSSREFSFEVYYWQVFLLLFLLLASVVSIVIYRRKHPKRTIPRNLSPKLLPLPKEGDIQHNNFRVIRAKREVEQQRISSSDFAIIVEQTVNTGDLPPEAGVKLLEPYGYELVLNSDKTVIAQIRRRRK